MSIFRLRGGITEMVVSSLLFSIMSALVRLAAGIDVWKTSLFRFAIGTAVLVTLAMARRIKLEFFNSRLLFLRGLLGGFGVFFYFLAISTLGLAKGTVISYTYPVFAAIGGALFLKDKVRPAEWALMALSLLGLFLLSPGFFAAQPADASLLHYCLAVSGALISGAAIVCVKKLSGGDSTFAIFLAQCLIGFWMVVIPANLTPVSLGLAGGVMLLAIGLVATAAQLLMTWSYGKISIVTGSLIGLITPAINVLIGVAVFNEPLTLSEALGTLVILASCLGIVLIEERKK